MPKSPKFPSGPLPKWISAGPIAVVASLTLMLLLWLNLGVGLQMGWGNVATWASSIASTAVLIGLAWMTRTQAVANKLTTAQLRANGVRIRCDNQCDADPPHWLIALENRSKDEIYRIEPSGIAVRSQRGDGAVLQHVQLVLDDSGVGGTVLKDGADYVYKAIAVDPTMVRTHHGLPGVAWTAPTGHRFRSVYPLVSGIPDTSASWEFVEMDMSHVPASKALRP